MSLTPSTGPNILSHDYKNEATEINDSRNRSRSHGLNSLCFSSTPCNRGSFSVRLIASPDARVSEIRQS